MVTLLFDANMSRRTAEAVRALGVDVVHVTDIGMGSAADEEIYKIATIQGDVLVTFDLDFTRLSHTSSDKSASIIIFRIANQTPASVYTAFLRLVHSKAWTFLQASGMTVIVGEQRIRIRS